ncbi:MAG: acyl carrier protein [Alphaproteobacteria bacterium]|nr:acyl carrier protein [Alphaproteobacteria bacterium]
MNDQQIITVLNSIFRDILGDPAISLTPETTADDVVGWDSMTHITIVVEAEGRFSVKFNTAEVEELKNVGEFVALIAKKVSR